MIALMLYFNAVRAFVRLCWLLWTSVLRKLWILRTDVPSAMPLQGREEHESLREPGDQIEELFRD
jgi:hypothetical protein